MTLLLAQATQRATQGGLSAGAIIALASVGAVIAIAIVGASWHLGTRMAGLMVELQRLRTRMLKLEMAMRQEIRTELARHVQERHPLERPDPSLTGIPLQAEP